MIEPVTEEELDNLGHRLDEVLAEVEQLEEDIVRKRGALEAEFLTKARPLFEEMERLRWRIRGYVRRFKGTITSQR